MKMLYCVYSDNYYNNYEASYEGGSILSALEEYNLEMEKEGNTVVLEINYPNGKSVRLSHSEG